MQHSLRRVLVALLLAVAEHTHFTPTPLSSSLLSLSFRRADNSSTPHGSCCCSVEYRRTVRSRTACETHLSFGHLAACPCCRLCLHSSLRCSSSAATQLSIGRLLQRLTAYRTSAIHPFFASFFRSSTPTFSNCSPSLLAHLVSASQMERFSSSSFLLSQTSLLPLLRSAESLCAGWSASFPH